jgi:hypothetical protein
MQEDRRDRADDPGGRLGAAHPLGELRAEDGGDAEAARSFDHIDQALSGLRDRGELVDDQQDAVGARLATDRRLRELFEQEAGEVAGLVFQSQPVEEEVAGVDLLEREAAVEGAGDGGEEGGVAGADRVELLTLKRSRLGGRRRCLRVQLEQGSRRSRPSSSAGLAWRPARGVAREPDGVDGEIAVVGAAALVGEVDQLQDPTGDLVGRAAPAVVGSSGKSATRRPAFSIRAAKRSLICRSPLQSM